MFVPSDFLRIEPMSLFMTKYMDIHHNLLPTNIALDKRYGQLMAPNQYFGNS
jgi:hypothetical protein